MSGEGHHEIQLNGKQLVFLFMTATVVAVVIFLCGVMVGRGVQAPASSLIASESPRDPTANLEAAAPVAASSGTTTSPSASSTEELSYSNRLEEPTPVNEVLREATSATATTTPATALPVTPATAKAPAVKAPNTKSATKPPIARPSTARTPRRGSSEAAVAVEPRGEGFVIQVAAVRQRAEADTIRRRLAGKGYPAFVTTAGAEGPAVFRVRVGKYDSRREAESIASRLEREEQFKPWITR